MINFDWEREEAERMSKYVVDEASNVFDEMSGGANLSSEAKAAIKSAVETMLDEVAVDIVRSRVVRLRSQPW